MEKQSIERWMQTVYGRAVPKLTFAVINTASRPSQLDYGKGQRFAKHAATENETVQELQRQEQRRSLQANTRTGRSGRSPSISPDRSSAPSSPYSVPQIAPLPSSTLCPVCNTTELNFSPQQPNFNTCTQCHSVVCNQCGFNPNPHLTEVKEWLCLNCQMQRALGMDMTTATRSKSQQQIHSPSSLSPSHQPKPETKLQTKTGVVTDAEKQSKITTSGLVQSRDVSQPHSAIQKVKPDTSQTVQHMQAQSRPTAEQKQMKTSPHHQPTKPTVAEQQRGAEDSPAKGPLGPSPAVQDQSQEGITGKLFGFGASLLNQASTLISVQPEQPASTQSSPAKVTPKIVFSDASKESVIKDPGLPSAAPGKAGTTPSHMPGKPAQSSLPKEIRKPKVCCPLCKIELNVGSVDLPNYNSCTGCGMQVCNMCGFNPTPHLVQVKEWLCLNCQTQRLLAGSLGDAPLPGAVSSPKAQTAASPRHQVGVSPQHKQQQQHHHQQQGMAQQHELSHGQESRVSKSHSSQFSPAKQPESITLSKLQGLQMYGDYREEQQQQSSKQTVQQQAKHGSRHISHVTSHEKPTEIISEMDIKQISETAKTQQPEDTGGKPVAHDVSKSPQSTSDTGYSSDGISSSQSEITGLLNQEEEKQNEMGLKQHSPPSPSEFTKLESTVRPLLESKTISADQASTEKMFRDPREEHRQRQRPHSLSITPEAFDSDEELEDILEEDEDSLEWENQRDARESMESSDDFGCKLRHDYVEDSSEGGFSPLPGRQRSTDLVITDEEFMRRQLMEMSADEDNGEDDDAEIYDRPKRTSMKKSHKVDSEKAKSSSKRHLLHSSGSMYAEETKELEDAYKASEEEELLASQGGLRRFKTIELNSTNGYSREMDLSSEVDLSLDREPELEMESLTGSPDERSRGEYSSTLPATTPSYTSGTSPTSLSSLEEDSDSSPSRRQRLEEAKQQRKARHRSHGPLLPTIEDSSEEEELREEEELLREQEKMREVEQQRIRSTARKTKRDKEELRAQRRRERSKTPPSNLSPIEDASPTEELRQAAEMEELHRSSCSEYSPSIDSEAEGFDIISSKLYKSGSEYNLPTFMSLYSPTEKATNNVGYSTSKTLKSAEEVYEEMMKKAEMLQKHQKQPVKQSKTYANNYQQGDYRNLGSQNSFEYHYINDYSYIGSDTETSQNAYDELSKSEAVYEEILQTSQNISRMHQSSSLDLGMQQEDKKIDGKGTCQEKQQLLHADSAYNDPMKQSNALLTPGTSPTQISAPVSFSPSESGTGARPIPDVKVTQHFTKDREDQQSFSAMDSKGSNVTTTSVYVSTTCVSDYSRHSIISELDSAETSKNIQLTYKSQADDIRMAKKSTETKESPTTDKADISSEARKNASFTSKVFSFFKTSDQPLSPSSSPTQSPTQTSSQADMMIRSEDGDFFSSDFSTQTFFSDATSTKVSSAAASKHAQGTQTVHKATSSRLTRQQSSQDSTFMVITLASDASQSKPLNVNASVSPVSSPTRLSRQQSLHSYAQPEISIAQTLQDQMYPTYTKVGSQSERISLSSTAVQTSVAKVHTTSTTITAASVYSRGTLPMEHITLCRISSVPGTSRVEPGPKPSSSSAIDLRTATKPAPIIITDQGMDLTSLASESRRYSLGSDQMGGRQSTAIQPLIMNLNTQEKSQMVICTSSTVSITVAASMYVSQPKLPAVYGDPFQSRVDLGQAAGSAVCLHAKPPTFTVQHPAINENIINTNMPGSMIKPEDSFTQQQAFARYNLPNQMPQMVKKDIVVTQSSNVQNIVSGIPRQLPQDQGFIPTDIYGGSAVELRTQNLPGGIGGVKPHTMMVQLDNNQAGTVTKLVKQEQPSNVLDLTGMKSDRQVACCDVVYKFPFGSSCTRAFNPPPKMPEKGVAETALANKPMPSQYYGTGIQDSLDSYHYRAQSATSHDLYREQKSYSQPFIGRLHSSMSDSNLAEAGLSYFPTRNELQFQPHGVDSAVDLTTVKQTYGIAFTDGSYLGHGMQYGSFTDLRTPSDLMSQQLPMRRYSSLSNIPSDYSYSRKGDLSSFQESSLAHYSATTAREISRMCAALNSMDHYGARHTGSKDILQYGQNTGPTGNLAMPTQQTMTSIIHNPSYPDVSHPAQGEGFGSMPQYNIGGPRQEAVQSIYPSTATVRAADGMIYSTINTPIASTLPITTQPASVLRPLLRGIYRPYGLGSVTAVPIASLTRLPLVAPRMPLAPQNLYRSTPPQRFVSAPAIATAEAPMYLGKSSTTVTATSTDVTDTVSTMKAPQPSSHNIVSVQRLEQGSVKSQDTLTAVKSVEQVNTREVSQTLLEQQAVQQQTQLQQQQQHLQQQQLQQQQQQQIQQQQQQMQQLQQQQQQLQQQHLQQQHQQQVQQQQQETQQSTTVSRHNAEKEKEEERLRKQQEQLLQLERERVELEKIRQIRLQEELERERLELQRHREKEQMLVQREIQELQTIKQQVLHQQQEERQTQLALQREQLAQQRMQLEQIQQLQQQLQQQLEEQKRAKIPAFPAISDQAVRASTQVQPEMSVEVQRNVAQNGQYWPPINQQFVEGISVAAVSVQEAQVQQACYAGPQRPLPNSASEMSLRSQEHWEGRSMKKRSSMPRLRDAYEGDDGRQPYVKKIADSCVQTDDEETEDRFYVSRRRRSRRSVDCSVQTDDEDNADWEQPVRRRRTRFTRHSDSSSERKHDSSKGTSSIAIQTTSDCSVQTEPDQLQRVSPTIQIITPDPKVEIIKYISAPEKTQKGESLACQTEPEGQSQVVVVPQLTVPTTVPPYATNIQMVTSGPLDSTSTRQGTSKFEKKKPDPLEIGYQSTLPTEPLSQLTRQPPKSPQVLYSPVSPLSPHRLLETSFSSSERLNKAHVTPQKHFATESPQRQQTLPRPIKTMQRSMSDPKPVSPTSDEATRSRYSLYQQSGFQATQISSLQQSSLVRKVKRTLPSPPPEEVHALLSSQAHTMMYSPTLSQKAVTQSIPITKPGLLKEVDKDLQMVDHESSKLRKKQAELDEEEKEIDAKLRYLEMGITQRKETLIKDRERRDFSYLRCLGENRDYMSDSELNNLRLAAFDSSGLFARPNTTPVNQYTEFAGVQYPSTSSYNAYQYPPAQPPPQGTSTYQHAGFQQPHYPVPSTSQTQTTFQSHQPSYSLQTTYQSHGLPQSTTYQPDPSTQSHTGYQPSTLYQAPTTYQNQNSFQPVHNTSFQPQNDLLSSQQKPRQTSLADLEQKITTNYEIIGNPTVVVSLAPAVTTFSTTPVTSSYNQQATTEMRTTDRGSNVEGPSTSYSSENLYTNLEQNIPRNYVMIDDISELTKENSPPVESQKLEQQPQSMNGRHPKERTEVTEHTNSVRVNTNSYSKVEEESEEDVYDHHRGKSNYHRGPDNGRLKSSSGGSSYYYPENDYKYSSRTDRHASNVGIHKHSSKSLAPAVVSSKRSKHRKQGMEQKISKFSPIEEAKDVENDLASYTITTSAGNSNVVSRAKKLQEEITYGLKKNVYEQQKYYGVTSRDELEEDDRIYTSGSRSRSSGYGLEKPSSRDLVNMRSKSYERDIAERSQKTTSKSSALGMSQNRGRAPMRSQTSEEESPLSPLGKPMGMSRSSSGHPSPIPVDSRAQFGSSHSLPDVQDHVKDVPRSHTYKQDEGYNMDDMHCAVSDSEAYHLGQEETDWFSKPRDVRGDRSRHGSGHSASSQRRNHIKHTYHDYDEPPDEDLWQQDDYSQTRHSSSSSSKEHRQHGESGKHYSSSRHASDEQSRRSSKPHSRDQTRHESRQPSQRKSQQTDQRTQQSYSGSSTDYTPPATHHHASEPQKAQKQPAAQQQLSSSKKSEQPLHQHQQPSQRLQQSGQPQHAAKHEQPVSQQQSSSRQQQPAQQSTRQQQQQQQQPLSGQPTPPQQQQQHQQQQQQQQTRSSQQQQQGQPPSRQQAQQSQQQPLQQPSQQQQPVSQQQQPASQQQPTTQPQQQAVLQQQQQLQSTVQQQTAVQQQSVPQQARQPQAGSQQQTVPKVQPVESSTAAAKQPQQVKPLPTQSQGAATTDSWCWIKGKGKFDISSQNTFGAKLGPKLAGAPTGGQAPAEGESMFSKILPGAAAEQAGKITDESVTNAIEFLQMTFPRCISLCLLLARNLLLSGDELSYDKYTFTSSSTILPLPSQCDDNMEFLNELNTYFSRFEKRNNTTAMKLPTNQEDEVLRLHPADVQRVLRSVTPRKAIGPDSILGWLLRNCADQLTTVLTGIFNISLHQAIPPKCFMNTTIIPLPKKSSPSSLNDYRLAFTSTVMKCFERVVKDYLASSLPATLDPLQFAYRSSRSTAYAISLTLHLFLAHLENKNCSVCMLFIDFSSTFHTVIPQHLIEKLVHLGVSTPLCNWILDFLIDRRQKERDTHNADESGSDAENVIDLDNSLLNMSLYENELVDIHALDEVHENERGFEFNTGYGRLPVPKVPYKKADGDGGSISVDEIREGEQQDFEKFVEDLNTSENGLTFTYELSATSITHLDVELLQCDFGPNHIRSGRGTVDQQITGFEKEVTKLRKLQVENSYLKECVCRQQIPKGLRTWKFPTGTVAGSELHKELLTLFNKHCCELLDVLIRDNNKKMNALKIKIDAINEDLHNNLLFQTNVNEYNAVLVNTDKAMVVLKVKNWKGTG
ncbi:protein bassoon [Protopterus annectens]|uniref:protein bassoon n=1 Tax=Protopterus annectens TaxID=7888 RepID=UPI001CF93FE3|nr:protein bassoon [Protopterus annectens]